MKKTIPIIISAVLATILLTVGIGLVKNVNGKQLVVSPTENPVVTQYANREQQYQQLIADANTKISLANQQIEDLANQISTLSDSTPSDYVFTAEQAAVLAENIAGAAPMGLPELVNFNGTAAYEAIFENGKVYVDANKGSILFNGLQAKTTEISPEQAVNLASRYLNRSDVVSIDVTSFQGVNVYVVGFSDGTLVYVNITGQIVAIQMPQSSSSTNNGEDEHDEHEEDDDD